MHTSLSFESSNLSVAWGYGLEGKARYISTKLKEMFNAVSVFDGVALKLGGIVILLLL
ncbi:MULTISPECIES: hypothetical protein [Pseudomonas]|uniref:hypothetical protein n=1 Tax=Pseudomonas TaxID=286 RepID=UPI00218ABDAD|nr:hypothetical protein [Pseudomonas sp. LRP2-20]BDM23699.1 hypothetical protein KMS_R34550 [Pseudomonas sp. LRP2-20]